MNNDRYACTFSVDFGGADEVHLVELSQKQQLEGEADDGLWMVNLHCRLGGGGGGGGGGSGAGAGGVGGGGGTGGASTGASTVMLIDNDIGDWVPMLRSPDLAGKRHQRRKAEPREFWGGLLDGGCWLNRELRHT